MLTETKLEMLIEARQKSLDGLLAYNAIPNEWVEDLMAMLSDMAMRNEVLRTENRELRRSLDVKRAG